MEWGGERSELIRRYPGPPKHNDNCLRHQILLQLFVMRRALLDREAACQ
jgi:hypothetical protein